MTMCKERVFQIQTKVSQTGIFPSSTSVVLKAKLALTTQNCSVPILKHLITADLKATKTFYP